ncbi:MAG: outer membrane lipoprotein-sorting protein [Candidatus Bipolaricaulota bacterium]
MKSTTLGILTALFLFAAAASGLAQTGDEILDRMQDAFSIGGAESREGILLSLDVANVYATGVTTDVRMAVAAQSDDAGTSHALMYFLGGDDEGLIFLLETPENDATATRMWLYISSFGLTKELISEEDQSGSFAGSTLTYEDIAGAGDLQDDYTASVLREETLVVGEESREVWVLELTPRGGPDAEFARILLWVDQEADLFLRLEGYAETGALAKQISVERLGEFEGRRVPEEMVGRDLGSGDVSTLWLSGLRRPDASLSAETFDPQNLDAFDPAAYGF